MNKITIFLGPSLQQIEAKKYIKNAEFKSPAKRGDIEKEIILGTKIIGLVDGMFYNQSAVGHKEILKALNNGIKIIGSSSMGALRACEMDKFGMIGIGKVYQLYKNRIIDSDDEVAILYDPINLEQLTEALVDIRETLLYSVNNHIINIQEYKKIIRNIQKINYSQRTYDYIFEYLVKNKIINLSKIKNLVLQIKNKGPINIKKVDCIELLKYINKLN